VCRKCRTVFPRFGCPRDKRITIKYIRREKTYSRHYIFRNRITFVLHTDGVSFHRLCPFSVSLSLSLSVSLPPHTPRGCLSPYPSGFVSISGLSRQPSRLWCLVPTMYIYLVTTTHVYRSARDGPVPFSPRNYTVHNVRRVRGPCLL